jgi:hypothetical protein
MLSRWDWLTHKHLRLATQLTPRYSVKKKKSELGLSAALLANHPEEGY